MKSMAFDLVKENEWQSDPTSPTTDKKSLLSTCTLRGPRLTRWRQVILTWACAALLISILNLGFVVWAENYNSKYYNGKARGGIRTLYEGDCRTTEKLSTVTHVVINVFSSILFAACSYTMQCLSAPTRDEVDRAHAQSTWLDIGVLSLRNLRKIDKKRVFIWSLLGISSIPLHLFYNSTIFASLATNRYAVLLVNNAFISPSSTDFHLLETTEMQPETSMKSQIQTIPVANHYFQLAKSSKLEKLDPWECVSEYAPDYLYTRGTLLLVVSNSTSNSPFNPKSEASARFLSGNGVFESTEWLCNSASDAQGEAYKVGSVCGDAVDNLKDRLRDNTTRWRLYTDSQEVEVNYCLSEQVEQHCHLQYSADLAILVVIISFFKATVLTYSAFGIRIPSLQTIGDTISSFLQRPDIYTSNMCLFEKADFTREVPWTDVTMSLSRSFVAKTPPHRWHAVSRPKKYVLGTMFTGVLALTISFVVVGTRQTIVNGDSDIRTVMTTIGLGATSTSALISGPGWLLARSGPSGIISNTFVANTPQLLMSILYIICNGVITTMCMASEWSRFGIERKGLRISGDRRGAQRCTYFIQLPYRYGLPLLAIFIVLHWLISQCIFVVNIEFLDYLDDGTKAKVPGKGNILVTCGWSPVAILCTAIVELVLIGMMILGGWTKLKSGMPIVGSCSAAIAAACHPGLREEGGQAALSEVKWGVLESGDIGVGHCGFSMHLVDYPDEGKIYA